MPEGHTLKRLADDLGSAFAGRAVSVSSPQGRFAADASVLDGAVVLDAVSAGKHLFVEFEGDRVVHVHLGLIGRFDISTAEAAAPAQGAVRLRLATTSADATTWADLRGATVCELISSARRHADAGWSRPGITVTPAGLATATRSSSCWDISPAAIPMSNCCAARVIRWPRPSRGSIISPMTAAMNA